MLNTFLMAVGRHRRAVLTAGMVLSAGYLLLHVWTPSLVPRGFSATMAAVAVFFVLGIVAGASRRPARFVVRPRVPAFSTPTPPTSTFVALAFLVLGTAIAGTAIEDRRPDQWLAWGWLLAALLHVAVAWRDQSVQLRPDGLWQRGITGWLVVPWDAVPTVPALPPAPSAAAVPLSYGRPDLVRRHGLHLNHRVVNTRDIDPRLLTAAIRYYTSHPEHRPAIGTHAEHARLMPLLLGSSLPQRAAAA